MFVFAIHFSPGGSYAGAVIAVGGFLALLTLVGKGRLSSLVVGKDGRTSTSKLQTFLWTMALAFAVLALILQGVTDIDIVPDYLYLLGFPALALLLSKSIVQQKISNGDVVKVAPAEAASPLTPEGGAAVVAPAATPQDGAPGVLVAGPATAPPGRPVPPVPNRSWGDWLGDIINNDEGQPDIADFQYVLFNLIALAYFFIHFFDTPGKLPQIPQTLIVLTGASAGTYVGSKLVQNQSPVLTGATPPSTQPGSSIVLRGSNLDTAGSGIQGGIAVTTVTFDSTAVAPSSLTDTTVVVTVPDVSFDQGAASKAVQVSVTNAVGSQSNQIPLTVTAPPQN